MKNSGSKIDKILIGFLIVCGVLVVKKAFFKSKPIETEDKVAVVKMEAPIARKPSQVLKKVPTAVAIAPMKETNAKPAQSFNLSVQKQSEINLAMDQQAERAKQEEEMRYKSQKLQEFLKYKVGLTDKQIQMVGKRNLVYQQEKRVADLLTQYNAPNAQLFKKTMQDNYTLWMSFFMRPEQYQEYLSLASY